MAEKIKHPVAIDYGNSKVTRSLTDKPPAHFTLKIDSFSLLYKIMVVRARAQSYESEVFEAGGYKWKLSLYPDGDKGNNAQGYISLYLVIVDTYDLPRGWKVSANLKFFLYDQLQNKYLTIQDGKAKASRFDVKNTAFGFARVLPLCSLLHAGNGYLVQDQCIFGVEVLVMNYIGTGCTVESLAVVKAHYTWTIEKFSSLSQERLISDVFTVGNRKWKLWLCPKGDSHAKNTTLSVYLEAEDLKKYPEQKAFLSYEFRIVNQCGGKDMRIRSSGSCFTKAAPCRGYSAFLPLADLRDASKGYLLNDTLILKSEVNVFSTVRSFLKMTPLPDLNAEQFQKIMVQNQELKKLTVMNFSGTTPTAAANATKLPQGSARVEEWLAQNQGKSSSKKSGTEASQRIPTSKSMV